MRHLIDRFCFWWLGQSYTKQYNVPLLFGASTANHETRKRNWQRALVRLYKDKALLDFLYYQAESDKENVWRAKVDPQLARGARVRTLFLVHSAHRAYLETRKRAAKSQGDAAAYDDDMKELGKAYKQTVDIGAVQDD